MKNLLLFIILLVSTITYAQHGFIIKDSVSTIFVANSHTDVGQLVIFIQSVTEASDSSSVTANLIFYSDTINYNQGISTRPLYYTIPFNSNQFTVALTNKIWVTMPQVLTYLKNWWQQQGYGIKANLN